MVWSLPAADAELGAVARSRCKQLHPSLGQKKFNLVTWLPRQNHEASVGILVLGDSYADHFDMGFECWQTLLARQCRLSSLNVACGGDTEKTAKTPSLMLSQGIVKRSLEENQKLLKMVAKQQEAALKHNANLSATTSPSRR